MKTDSPEENTETEKLDRDSKPDVIAHRKTCDAEGTGLSHYVLMDKPAAK